MRSSSFGLQLRMPARRHQPPPQEANSILQQTPSQLDDCASRCHDRVDSISRLPVDVITNILSLLSFKEAAITSVVSPLWSDLWKHTPNLIFETKSYAKQIAELRGLGYEYLEWVNSVLNSHKAFTLKEFKISFVVNESVQCAVTKWLGLVSSRQVVRLELNFRLPVGKHGADLDKILTESSCDLTSLKELCLRNFQVSIEAMKVILRKCPLLELLVIQGPQDVNRSRLERLLMERKRRRRGRGVLFEQHDVQVFDPVDRCPQQHLQVLEHWGFYEGVAECVRYVADNCVALNQVRIRSRSTYADLDAHTSLCSKLPSRVQLLIVHE